MDLSPRLIIIKKLILGGEGWRELEAANEYMVKHAHHTFDSERPHLNMCDLWSHKSKRPGTISNIKLCLPCFLLGARSDDLRPLIVPTTEMQMLPVRPSLSHQNMPYST